MKTAPTFQVEKAQDVMGGLNEVKQVQLLAHRSLQYMFVAPHMTSSQISLLSYLLHILESQYIGIANTHTEVPIPRAAECNCVWRKGF